MRNDSEINSFYEVEIKPSPIYSLILAILTFLILRQFDLSINYIIWITLIVSVGYYQYTKLNSKLGKFVFYEDRVEQLSQFSVKKFYFKDLLYLYPKSSLYFGTKFEFIFENSSRKLTFTIYNLNDANEFLEILNSKKNLYKEEDSEFFFRKEL